MRIKMLSLAVALIATLSASLAWAGNQEVAQSVAQELRASSRLSDYKINIKFDNGTCWLRGRVNNREQLYEAIDVARGVQGVERVINELSVEPSAAAAQRQQQEQVAGPTRLPQPAVVPSRTAPTPRPAADLQPTLVDRGVQPARFPAPQPQNGPNLPTPAPIQPVAQPVAPPAPQMPHRAQQGPIRQVGYPMQSSGGPVPVAAASYGYGGAHNVRYDHPQLPQHAWPSYAPYPNYAAVTYPKVYSPAAWPYIGPFYPYPQVPLGWRRVTLEWDDGWWWLDFDDHGWRR